MYWLGKITATVMVEHGEVVSCEIVDGPDKEVTAEELAMFLKFGANNTDFEKSEIA